MPFNYGRKKENTGSYFSRLVFSYFLGIKVNYKETQPQNHQKEMFKLIYLTLKTDQNTSKFIRKLHTKNSLGRSKTSWRMKGRNVRRESWYSEGKEPPHSSNSSSSSHDFYITPDALTQPTMGNFPKRHQRKRTPTNTPNTCEIFP